MKYSKIGFPIHSILVGIVLLCIIVGGGVIFLHNPIWTLDDATIIQSTVGSGRMMHVWDEPGFQPKAGRFFPLAYMHTNLLLLFTNGYVDATPFYVLNAVLWVAFVLLCYYLCYNLLKNITKTETETKWIAVLVLLVIAQRTIDCFACLWTTICIDLFLTLLCCVLFIKYENAVGEKRILFGLFFIVSLIYFAYCIEVNIVVPIVVGIGLMLVHRKCEFVSLASLSIALVFFLLYWFLIARHTVAYYDSSHGSSDSVWTNAMKMLMLQKMLILMVIVFLYRLYLVLVKRQSFKMVRIYCWL